MLMVIGFLLVLGPLIFSHELGHFVLAKCAGIRVLEFGFGYPPRLLKLWQDSGRITIAGVRIVIPKNFKAPLPYNEFARLFKRPALKDQSAGFGILDRLAVRPRDVMEVMDNGRFVEAAIAARPDGTPVLQSIKLLNPSADNVEEMQTPSFVRGQVSDYVPGTEYTLNWIPVGGFTRMLGEEDPSAPDSFAAAPKRWRSAVLVAGPGFNLILAFIIFVVTFMTGWPEPTDYRVVIGETRPGAPAETAGLKPYDIVLAVNGQTINTPDELVKITWANLGRPITLLIQRDKQTFEITATPRREDEFDKNKEGPLGISIGIMPTNVEVRYYSLIEALPRASGQVAAVTSMVVAVPVMVLRGLIPLTAARPVGPLGISQIAGAQVEESIRLGGLYPILQLAAVLSIAIGLTNLLPLPALDGGRLLFIIVELIRRKRVDPKKETVVHLIGIAILLTLMMILTVQEIFNPVSIPKSF